LDPIGQMAIVFGLLLMILGGVVIKKLVVIKV